MQKAYLPKGGGWERESEKGAREGERKRETEKDGEGRERKRQSERRDREKS